MAYDVIKNIAGRQYRYRVESGRDPVTGKVRNRWTYVGRVASERDVPKPRAPRVDSRRKLLEAMERLLETGEAAGVTPHAIAREAGLAHGTFYRYFKDRSKALEALAAQMRETHGALEENLRDDVASLDDARSGVRSWMSGKLRLAKERPATIRAWYALMGSDVRLAAYREERQEAMSRRLREHLAVLTERGFAHVPDPESTATVILAMFQGLIHETILRGHPLDEPQIAAAADVLERAIFTSVESA